MHKHAIDEVCSTLNQQEDKRCLQDMNGLDDALQIQDFHMFHHFKKVCNVVIDDDVSANGKKSRKTEIKFAPTIPEAEWKSYSEWIYILTCDDKIIKFGGTRTGLNGRACSYLCGRPQFRRAGTCSTTNYIVYMSTLNLLKRNHKVAMYAKQLERQRLR